MSLAAETRRAADEHPFLVAGLRAGVVNFTAAARFLDVDGETEAVATALRRYGDSLPDRETSARDVRVTMESGLGPADEPADAVLVAGGTALGPGTGDRTGIIATGDVDAAALRSTLDALVLEEVSVRAAGVGDESLVIAVDRSDAATAVRAVENALERVPN